MPTSHLYIVSIVIMSKWQHPTDSWSDQMGPLEIQMSAADAVLLTIGGKKPKLNRIVCTLEDNLWIMLVNTSYIKSGVFLKIRSTSLFFLYTLKTKQYPEFLSTELMTVGTETGLRWKATEWYKAPFINSGIWAYHQNKLFFFFSKCREGLVRSLHSQLCEFTVESWHIL